MLSLLLAPLIEMYIKLRNTGENKLSNPPEIIDLPDRPYHPGGDISIFHCTLLDMQERLMWHRTVITWLLKHSLWLPIDNVAVSQLL